MALECRPVGEKISEDVYWNWEKHSKFDEDCRHTRTYGSLGKSDDVILYKEEVHKEWEIGKASHIFTYSCAKGERITAAIAYDLWSDGTGGYPELLSRSTRVTVVMGKDAIAVEVKSQLLRGFHFQFVVYGKIFDYSDLF